MDDKSLIETAIRQAKKTINIGLMVMVFCLFWFVQNQFYPDLFQGNDNISQLDSLQNDFVEPPMFELDSASIENGIHIPTGLIVDDGVQDVMTTCGACHSLDLVTQNRATEEGWKEIIVWMQETQGLWDLGDREEIIITYLGKNYAPENTGRRKNLENVEWYNL
ncbi:MAG: hypothetical protein BM555_01410 [Crocinitomix sp. MedPE-SWsnd]|jgi:hypothetical protein|nr:MAG: hypothetical protein BM555_01410 [Crocinitomix sp. MedPE-SWsnd]